MVSFLKKKVAILLIFLGVIIIIYPFTIDFYAKYQQRKLLNSYVVRRDITPQILVEELYDEIERFNVGIETSKEEMESKLDNVIGLINIPKINLTQLPILYDATVANLDKSAAMIKGTSFPWEGGNTAIAGHRGRAAWLHFNRLNELEHGDSIILEIEGKAFLYEVYETSLVLPHEVDVLDDIPGETTITLITCDPPVNNASHRLIVRGRLQHP